MNLINQKIIIFLDNNAIECKGYYPTKDNLQVVINNTTDHIFEAICMVSESNCMQIDVISENYLRLTIPYKVILSIQIA